MNENNKFCPNKPISLAHRNAIKKARPEDLSYHRKVSQGIIDKQAISLDGLKSNGNKLKHLASMVRQIYFLENPFDASDSVLAAAVWMDECRKLYQEQLAKMEGKVYEEPVANPIDHTTKAVEVKRKRGRPRKDAAIVTIVESQPKKKRGRPCKVAVSQAKAHAVEADMDRSIVSFPIAAPSLISAMMVDIQDGRLKVTMEVDVREAVRLYANQINKAQEALVR